MVGESIRQIWVNVLTRTSRRGGVFIACVTAALEVVHQIHTSTINTRIRTRTIIDVWNDNRYLTLISTWYLNSMSRFDYRYLKICWYLKLMSDIMLISDIDVRNDYRHLTLCWYLISIRKIIIDIRHFVDIWYWCLKRLLISDIMLIPKIDIWNEIDMWHCFDIWYRYLEWLSIFHIMLQGFPTEL